MLRHFDISETIIYHNIITSEKWKTMRNNKIKFQFSKIFNSIRLKIYIAKNIRKCKNNKLLNMINHQNLIKLNFNLNRLSGKRVNLLRMRV